MAETVQQLLRDHRDSLDIVVAGDRHRIKIDSPLIRGLDIIATRVPRMELHRRHLHCPDHVRQMIDAKLIGIAIEARKVHAYGLDPRRRAMRQPFLVNLFAVDAIGEAVQHARSVIEGIDDAVRDREVVPSKIKFGLATCREINPVRIADLDNPISDLQLDALRGHARHSNRVSAL